VIRSCLLSRVSAHVTSTVCQHFYIVTAGGIIVNRKDLYNHNEILNFSIEELTPSRHVRYAVILGSAGSASARGDQDKEQHAYHADW